MQAVGLLDSEPQAAFDAVVDMAKRSFDVPIALISLVDADRQWFLARSGLDATQTGRAESFCGHAIHAPDATFVVVDAANDERFHDNPLVTGEPRVRFYAGRPIRGPAGHALGTVCIIDHEPRSWNDDDDAVLRGLARWAEAEVARHARRSANEAAVGSGGIEAIHHARFWELSQDICCVATPDGVLLDANARLSEILGHDMSHMIGANFLGLIHPLDDAATRVYLHELKRGRSDEITVRVRGADGRYRHIAWTCVLESGLIYAAGRDVTDRERNVLQMRDLNKALARSNRDLRDFASFTAHELRGPVRTMSGFARLLQRRAGAEADLSELADRVAAGAERLDVLIHDMLELTRINNDVTPHDLVPGGHVIEAVERAVHGAYPHADLQWDALPDFCGNENQIIQLFTNLIENGAKYQPPGARPRIEVRAALSPARVSISIQDNGIGIPPEHCSTIFEPFRRVHDRDQYDGTGIGLAMCKKIVVRHGGRIRAMSDVGIGSTIVFDLPLAETTRTPLPHNEKLA